MTKEAFIKIKTPVGVTKEKSIEEVILQGETLSSILCTSTMDRVSTECTLEPFKYKEKVNIPKMGFVDNIFDVTKCGSDAKEMSDYTRKAINERKLQLNHDKCVRIHIGKRKEDCKDLEMEMENEGCKKEFKGNP